MKIIKVGEKKYKIDFTLYGKRKRHTIEGSRKAAEQAVVLLKEKIYRQKYGVPEPKKKIRFEDYAKIYEERYTMEKRAWRNEQYVLKRLKSSFKDQFLHEITVGDIERFKTKRKKDGLCNSTVNRELAVLKAIFNRAIDSEDYALIRNPVCKVDFLKEDSFRERRLSSDEIKRLLEASVTPWSKYLPLFLTIALNTAMRKSEILSLKWENVNFKRRYIEVTRERSKSRKTRKVPMNDVVIAALSKVKKTNQYIFFNPKTDSHIKHMKEAFNRACEKAGIEDCTPHDLRHTAASLLVNDCGVDIVTASKILGHSKIEMTMRYIHSSDEHKQRGVDMLGEIFKESRHKVDTLPFEVHPETPSPPQEIVH